MLETDVPNNRIDKLLPSPFTRFKVEERENSDWGVGVAGRKDRLSENSLLLYKSVNKHNNILK